MSIRCLSSSCLFVWRTVAAHPQVSPIGKLADCANCADYFGRLCRALCRLASRIVPRSFSPISLIVRILAVSPFGRVQCPSQQVWSIVIETGVLGYDHRVAVNHHVWRFTVYTLYKSLNWKQSAIFFTFDSFCKVYNVKCQISAMQRFRFYTSQQQSGKVGTNEINDDHGYHQVWWMGGFPHLWKHIFSVKSDTVQKYKEAITKLLFYKQCTQITLCKKTNRQTNTCKTIYFLWEMQSSCMTLCKTTYRQTNTFKMIHFLWKVQCAHLKLCSSVQCNAV